MLTGWKAIIDYTKFSRKVIRRLMAEEKFPVQYIAQRPATTSSQIDEWMQNRLKSKNMSR